MRTDPMFVLIGPSAAGKSTIAKMLVENLGMTQGITATTRNRRDGEALDAYHFVNKRYFLEERMIEWVHYSGHMYGTPKTEVDKSNLLVMEPNGAPIVKDYCRTQGRECYLIGIAATKKQQAERMVQRGDAAADIERRISRDAKTFQHLERVCDLVMHAQTLEDLYARVAQYVATHLEQAH